MWHDLRHGLRMLARNPAFALVAMVSIAIGVGANTAMFSVADGLVLRPLPVPRPGEVVTVNAVSPAGVFRNRGLSYPEFEELRDQARSFEGLVAYSFVVTAFADRRNEPVQRRMGMAVSHNLLDAMRLRPALGRGFRPDEDRPGQPASVVLLDHDEWTTRFASDPSVIGRELSIGGRPFTVIGVAPRGFTSIDHEVQPPFYIPLAAWPNLQAGLRGDELTRRDATSLVVKGRLNSGTSVAQARAEVQQIAARLAAAYPDTNRGRSFTAQSQLESFSANHPSDTQLVTMLLLLAGAVLVVACANVGGLLASRAPVRCREIAVRLAAGAGRARVIRQLVTESLVLAAGGGLLGFGLGYVGIRAFQALEFPTDVPLKLTFALDGRAFSVGLVTALASAVFASVFPAWRTARADLSHALRDRGSAPTPGGLRLWGRSCAVSVQIALSLVVLTVAAFLSGRFQADLREGPGYRVDHLLMATFDPALVRYDDGEGQAFYDRLVERARAMPGVRSVALTTAIPMKVDALESTPVAPEGIVLPEGATNTSVMWARVDEGYFDALDIRLVTGRLFGATDTADTPPVAIVNTAFAVRYWPGQSAIGKRIRLDARDRAEAEVVGVVASVKNVFIAIPPGEYFYAPLRQHPRSQRTLLVRTEGDAEAMADPLRRAVVSVDTNVPIFGMRTMEDFYTSRAVYTTRLISASVASMGSMGLILAVVGLYGLVAYGATRRRREIGIRMAVGAPPSSILRMVLRQGLVLAVAGTTLGLAASRGMNGLLAGIFPGRGGVSLSTYALVTLTLVAVTLIAAYVPARRATRIDPLVALRTE